MKALAELSAQKRGLILPDKETTGREFGEYIKAQARTDRDQLLYEIVDRAVRKYGTPAASGREQVELQASLKGTGLSPYVTTRNIGI